MSVLCHHLKEDLDPVAGFRCLHSFSARQLTGLDSLGRRYRKNTGRPKQTSKAQNETETDEPSHRALALGGPAQLPRRIPALSCGTEK